MIAFSNACIVMISEGFNSSFASPSACSPALRAVSFNSGKWAGIKAEPGKAMPSASAITCIVEAVPMKEQAPQSGHASRL